MEKIRYRDELEEINKRGKESEVVNDYKKGRGLQELGCFRLVIIYSLFYLFKVMVEPIRSGSIRFRHLKPKLN